MKAEILAVGSELLTPYRVDTNSLYITDRLNAIGIQVRAKLVVGDDPCDLETAFRQMLDRADLVITTGGLGPTEDDLTRDAIAAAMGLSLSEDPAIVESIRRRFERRGLTMPDINRRQAMVPEGAVPLANPRGSAPGLWLERDGKIVVMLPGPPREMQPMLDAFITARLSALAAGRGIYRRSLRVTGCSESLIDEIAQPIYSRWQTGPRSIATTILTAPGEVSLNLCLEADDAAEGAAALDAAVRELASALGPDVFSTSGHGLEQVVGAMLRDRGLHVAVAESCTGGLLSSRLTDVPGSSAYVELGVVAYSNRAKQRLLDVPPEMIDEHGAVSEPVALAMAQGVRRGTDADVGIGITGVAGPGGGTEQKPVGMVAVAVVVGDESRVRTFSFMGERELVKFQSTQAALDMLRRMLISAQPSNPSRATDTS